VLLTCFEKSGLPSTIDRTEAGRVCSIGVAPPMKDTQIRTFTGLAEFSPLGSFVVTLAGFRFPLPTYNSL
jgi:hypothetical protein